MAFFNDFLMSDKIHSKSITHKTLLITFLIFQFFFKTIISFEHKHVDIENKFSNNNEIYDSFNFTNSITNINLYETIKLKSLRLLNSTSIIMNNNTVNNSTNNISNNPNEIIILQKTLIQISNEKQNLQCKNNLILNTLPVEILENIFEMINESPMQVNTKYCKFSGNTPFSSCCNDNTISLFSDYLNNQLILTKKNIFANNIFFFSVIQNEHFRNFVNGFGIKEENFNILFQDYKNLKAQIYNLTQEIVTQSIEYSWNSFCNLICRPDYFNLYNAYNITYMQNNSLSNDLLFEFFADNNKIVTINNLLNAFQSLQNSFNQRLDDIYNNIMYNSQFYNYSKANNKTEGLIQKSLQDGRNFFYQLNKALPCQNNLTKFNCSSIINKENICKPFVCLDNVFLQYFDQSTDKFSYSLDNYNYSKAIYAENTNVSLINFESEIAEIIKNNINFSSSSCMIIDNVFILIFYLTVIFFF